MNDLTGSAALTTGATSGTRPPRLHDPVRAQPNPGTGLIVTR